MPERLKDIVTNSVILKNTKLDISNFTAIDGFVSHGAILQMFRTAFSILLENNIPLENYLVKVELKNISYSYLFFATKNGEWVNFVCENSFRYSPKDYIEPFFVMPQKINAKNMDVVSAISASNCLTFPFGYMIDEYFKFLSSNDKLMAEHFPNRAYSNHEYYKNVFGVRY